MSQAFFRGREVVIATMHRKETVIAPLLEREAEIRAVVPQGFDTDRFGTFTRDVPRAGNQLEAARAKAEGALALVGGDLAIASEGSFGPHPALPFGACNIEIVLLLDRRNDLELVGRTITMRSNFSHEVVSSVERALDFAKVAQFPSHGLIVYDHHDPKAGRVVAKGITDRAALEQAVTTALERSPEGRVLMESDMRAMVNPTRMEAIGLATQDLVRLMRSPCPACAWPGFDRLEVVPGLPCEWCGTPTSLPLTHVMGCRRCDHRIDQHYPQGMTHADPGRCDRCNP